MGLKAPIGSAYYDPVGTATRLILADDPLPVDLQDDLASMGYILEEFRLSVITEDHAGYQLREAS